MSEKKIKSYELIINMSTIIPGKPPFIKFTRQMIYTQGLYEEVINKINQSLSNYPYFTYQTIYPYDKLKTYSYDSIIEFFFKKEKFEELLEDNIEIEENVKPNANDSEKDEYYNKRNDIVNKNILSMLKLLFPTRYPVINDINDSFTMYRGIDPLNTLFFNPLKKAPFSYLKIDSQTYTVQKVIWMNDFINHPRYRDYLLNARLEFPRIRTSNYFLENLKNVLSSDKKFKKEGIRTAVNECYEKGCEIYNILNVGVDMMSTTCEIYVMMDFIQGEVNNDNINNIYCPLYGEIAGNKLLGVIADATKSKKKTKSIKSNRVDNNRYMFSIKNNSLIQNIGKKDEELDDQERKIKEKDDFEYNQINNEIKNRFDEVYKILENDDIDFKDMVKDNNVTPEKLLLFVKRRYREFMNILSKNELTREDNKNIKILEKIIKRLEEQNRFGNEDTDILNYTKLAKKIFDKLLLKDKPNQFGGNSIRNHRMRNSRRNKKYIRLFTRKYKK
jgi:hypothetical protein